MAGTMLGTPSRPTVRDGSRRERRLRRVLALDVRAIEKRVREADRRGIDGGKLSRAENLTTRDSRIVESAGRVVSGKEALARRTARDGLRLGHAADLIPPELGGTNIGRRDRDRIASIGVKVAVGQRHDRRAGRQIIDHRAAKADVREAGQIDELARTIGRGIEHGGDSSNRDAFRGVHIIGIDERLAECRIGAGLECH